MLTLNRYVLFLFFFFLDTNTWSSVASLSNKRDAVAACLFGDKIIAVGGFDGSHYLHSVEEYDPITNEWKTLKSLKTGRAGACVIAVSSNVHVNE